MTQDYIKIGFHTLYISMAILLFSLLLAWLGSQRMLAPIRRILIQLGDNIIQKEYSVLPQKSANANDELEQIRMGVSQLSDAHSQLESTLTQHRNQIRNYAMMQLLQGKTSFDTLHCTLREQGYITQPLTWQQIAVVVIQPELISHSKYRMEDGSLLLFAIQNMLEEALQPNQQLVPIVLEQHVVTVIGSTGGSDDVFKANFTIIRTTTTTDP